MSHEGHARPRTGADFRGLFFANGGTMAKRPDVKSLVITALCTSLCVVLPLAFHLIYISASVFGPMHIPVLLCGLICGWKYGLICGLTGPPLSHLLTGMPNAGSLPAMTAELAVYGLIAGLLIRLVRTKNLYADLYIALIPAMIAGRVAGGAVRALTVTLFAPAAEGAYAVSMWATAYFVTSFPGIIAHLIIIPAIVVALTKARLVKL